MKNLKVILLSLVSMPAWAEAAPVQPSMSGQFIMLAGFVAIFYFLIWRPQSKRAKAHQTLMKGLSKGDEVVTSGGIMGQITAVSEQFVTLTVADNTDIKVQRQAIAANLPKGTLKAL